MERRLAAILFSDTVGYSALMGQNEARTHDLLKSIETDLIEPKAAQYHVRIMRLLGDGQLMEFPSVVEAVVFAIELQLHMRQRNRTKPNHEQIQFRIAINIGDIMVEPDDIYGDGVNVAARLESVAEPGGICLSRSAYEQVRDKLDIDFTELGPLELKNIARPVETYALQLTEKADALVTPVVPPKRATETLILLLHGFQARNDWQSRIRDQLQSDSSTETRVLGFGFSDVLRFIVSGLSSGRYLKQISQAIFSARRDYPEGSGRICVVAEGFAAAAVIQVLKENPHLSIDDLLLCRSVAHPRADWDQIDTQIKGKVLNECMTRDSGPLIARALNWRYGATGTYGFNTPAVIDRFQNQTRSGLLAPDFVRKFWLPFVERGEVVRDEGDPLNRQYPAYFPWLGGVLRGMLGAAAALVFLLGVGIVQFFFSDLSFNKDNIVCRCLRFVSPPTKEIGIGAISHFGKDSGALSKWAVQHAVDKAMASGGLTFQPRLLSRSSEGKKETVKAILADLKSEQTVAVVGPMGSEMAFYAKKWGNEDRVPVITANASASSLVREGVADYFFRVSMSDEARASALAEWMIGNERDLSPYIIHEWTRVSPNGEEPALYGMEQAATAARTMPQSARETTVIRFTRHDHKTMDEAVQRISNSEKRPIAIFGYTDNIIYIIRKLHERGIRNKIYLTGTYNKKVAEANFPFADRIHIVSDAISEEGYSTNIVDFKREFERASNNPKTDPEVVAAYRKAGKEVEDLDFDVVAAYAYDATNIVLDAIQRGFDSSCLGQIDGELVAEQLRRTSHKRRIIVHSGFLHDRQEMFHTLVRYKIGNDRRLFRFSPETN